MDFYLERTTINNHEIHIHLNEDRLFYANDEKGFYIEAASYEELLHQARIEIGDLEEVDKAILCQIIMNHSEDITVGYHPISLCKSGTVLIDDGQLLDLPPGATKNGKFHPGRTRYVHSYSMGSISFVARTTKEARESVNLKILHIKHSVVSLKKIKKDINEMFASIANEVIHE